MLHTVETVYDGNYDFKGLWDIPSKCGLRIVRANGNTIVIVTELYRDNPGTTITDVPVQLASQICSRFSVSYDSLVYIEHNPKTVTKLSFYEEEYYRVSFRMDGGVPADPEYRKITGEEVNEMMR